MHGTNKIRIILWLFACIVAIVLLDQWIKRLIVAWIGPGAQSHRQEVLGRFVAFEYLENRGAAFGMFQQGTNILALVSIVIVVVALVSIARFAGTEPWMAASISLIVGGAIGNAIDRIVRGYVVDYIAIGRFWKFNLADAAVTIGAVLTFILLLRYETAGRNASITQEHDA